MEIAAFLGILLLGLGSTYWHFKRSRTLLEHWAQKNGFRILESKYALLFMGPFTFRTSRGQAVYRVKVEIATGQVDTGWVRCGTWSFGVLNDVAEVRWD